MGLIKTVGRRAILGGDDACDGLQVLLLCRSSNRAYKRVQADVGLQIVNEDLGEVYYVSSVLLDIDEYAEVFRELRARQLV